MKYSPRIASLIADYYDTIDSIKTLRDKASALKHQILDIADPGKYGKYKVIETKEVEIHVNAYTRAGYRMIRRIK